MQGVKGTSVEGHPNYHRWENMKQRCFNPKNTSYYKYGGRGITVCYAWRTSFQKFIRDVGLPPSKKHTLDRKNNDLNYSCGHCKECKANKWKANWRWATAVQQAGNTRSRGSSSGYRGVTLNKWVKTKRGKKWTMQLGIKNGHISKAYRSRYQAALAYDREAIKYYGIEFATLNFPEKWKKA